MLDNHIQKVNSFNIIIYTRLSKEEEEKTKEEQSRSILNQIEICKKFIMEEEKNESACHFKIVAILKDDGISGTTFERNDFKKLVRLIEDKKANMVITKDLSRLGRNHVKTDDYIENWFPEHNVRYVSIMENVDTYRDTVSNEIAPLINWSNEYFARQTSKKIKSTFLSYRQKGKWTGGEPPLGYTIDPQNKYHFIIEPQGAEIVKRIFKLAKENNSIDDIAKKLIEEKVPIPTVIKNNRRILNQDLIELWNKDTIRKILKNEMYLGHMIQGKTTRLNHKSKKIIHLPKEQWVTIKNTHEPLISQQTFNEVQLLIKTNKNKTLKTHDYLLKGLIKCKECSHSIGVQWYKNRKQNYTICNYYRKYGSKKTVCTSHRRIYEELEQLVLDNIKNECLQYVDEKNLIEKLKKKIKTENQESELYANIKQSASKIWKLEKQMDTIYEDKLQEHISIEQYERVISKKQKLINYEQLKLKRLKKESEKFQQKKSSILNYEKIVKDFLQLKKPNKFIITSLIEKIELNKDGKIEIYYRFECPQRQ